MVTTHIEYYFLPGPLKCEFSRNQIWRAESNKRKPWEERWSSACARVQRERTKISLIRTHGAAFIAPWSVLCVGLGINLGSGSPSLNVFRVKSSSQGSLLYICKELLVILLRQRFWGWWIDYESDYFNVAHIGAGEGDWSLMALCFQQHIW